MEISYLTKEKRNGNGKGKSHSEVVLPSYLNSVNGSFAGAFSGLVTTPMDVVKTKLMTF